MTMNRGASLTLDSFIQRRRPPQSAHLRQQSTPFMKYKYKYTCKYKHKYTCRYNHKYTCKYKYTYTCKYKYKYICKFDSLIPRGGVPLRSQLTHSFWATQGHLWPFLPSFLAVLDHFCLSVMPQVAKKDSTDRVV